MLDSLLKSLKIDKKVKDITSDFNVKGLLKKLDPRDYFIINNSQFDIAGTTSQVDFIIVSVYGVFVINAKNDAGEIQGTETGANWKQFLNGEEIPTVNPIYQNIDHMKAIKEKLGDKYSDLKIVSIVVFPNETILKVTAENSHVINNCDLLYFIERYDEKVCSYNDIYTIKYILEQNDTGGIINDMKQAISGKPKSPDLTEEENEE